MNKRIQGTVAGESAKVLARQFVDLDVQVRPDGAVEVRGAWPCHEGHPLVAALMRVEADLLRLDADIVSAGNPAPRSPEQRRSHAILALLLRLGDRIRPV